MTKRYLTATDIAGETGLSVRYWQQRAARGSVPGAYQPSGPGGAWRFEAATFWGWYSAGRHLREDQAATALGIDLDTLLRRIATRPDCYVIIDGKRMFDERHLTKLARAKTAIPRPKVIGAEGVPPQDQRPTALYRFYADDGSLIYAGISRSAARRLSEHGEQPWFPLITRIDVEWYATRELATAAERRAIIDERPAFNVQHGGSAK